MINITKNGTTVCVEVQTGLSTQDNVLFTAECGNRMFAELLADKLRDKLNDAVQAIRESEYSSGYKAGRSKTTKRKYFYWTLENKNY